MKTKLIFIFLLFLMFSCVSSVEVSLESENPQLVLNSILNATQDSIVVTLSLSHSIVSVDAFRQVNDAKIELFENQQFIAQFDVLDSGTYVLHYRPIAGREYEIVARAAETSLKGKTIVPHTVAFNLSKLREERDDFMLSLKASDIYGANVWMNVLYTNWYGPDSLKKVPGNTIYSNSTFIDPFNRETDTYEQYAYYYDDYMFLSGYDDHGEVDIYFGFYGTITRSNEIIVSTFDDHLTRYVKSSIIAFNVERGKGEYPFYLDPAVVYSNVEGGIGIVGSMNSRSQEIFNQKKFIYASN
ncbi:MAG: DUF4249 family protein [Prolixibacteraceae bacterium]